MSTITSDHPDELDSPPGRGDQRRSLPPVLPHRLPLGRQFGLLFGRTMRDAVRDLPLAFVAPTLLAVFVSLMFGSVFEAIGSAPGFPAGSFLEWVAPGSVLLTAFVGAGYAASGLLRDVETGYLDRLRLLPVRPSVALGARIAFEGVRVVLPAAIVLVASLLLGAENRGGVGGAAAVLAITVGVAMTWNGVFFAVALRTRSQQAVLGLQPLFMPVVMFSTFFAPTEGAPTWFRVVAAANPFTHVLDGTRGVMLGDLDGTDLVVGLGAFLVIGLVTYRVAARAYTGLTTPD